MAGALRKFFFKRLLQFLVHLFVLGSSFEKVKAHLVYELFKPAQLELYMISLFNKVCEQLRRPNFVGQIMLLRAL